MGASQAVGAVSERIGLRIQKQHAAQPLVAAAMFAGQPGDMVFGQAVVKVQDPDLDVWFLRLGACFVVGHFQATLRPVDRQVPAFVGGSSR